MSDERIGETDDWGWTLLDRRGRVELAYHEDTERWGIYLYPNVAQGEDWLLYAIRRSEEAARQHFELVADALGEH